jgi:hypothetical protein
VPPLASLLGNHSGQNGALRHVDVFCHRDYQTVIGLAFSFELNLILDSSTRYSVDRMSERLHKCYEGSQQNC